MLLPNKSQKSKVESRKSSFEFVLLTAVVAALDSSTAFAQGCAMCYNTAAAAKAAAIHALRSGILILLIPPALMFIGIFAMAFRRQERFREGDENPRVRREAEPGFLRLRVRRIKALPRLGSISWLARNR